MSEFFTNDDWDEIEQIEYFENPIYSFLNDDEKKTNRRNSSRNQREK